jgi:hypothetical protein
VTNLARASQGGGRRAAAACWLTRASSEVRRSSVGLTRQLPRA